MLNLDFLRSLTKPRKTCDGIGGRGDLSLSLMNSDAKPSIGNGAIDWPQVLTDNCRWLQSVLYARLNDRQATEDVYQEVCCSVLSKTPVEVIAHPAAWLYRVAVRHAANYCRTQSRIRNRDHHYAQTKSPSTTGTWSNPQSWIFAQEQTEQITNAFCKLKTSERQVLFLKYNEDWTCKRIGNVIGVSETTVQTRLLRARKKLRRILARHFEEGKNNE